MAWPNPRNIFEKPRNAPALLSSVEDEVGDVSLPAPCRCLTGGLVPSCPAASSLSAVLAAELDDVSACGTTLVEISSLMMLESAGCCVSLSIKYALVSLSFRVSIVAVVSR